MKRTFVSVAIGLASLGGLLACNSVAGSGPAGGSEARPESKAAPLAAGATVLLRRSSTSR